LTIGNTDFFRVLALAELAIINLISDV